VTSTEFAHFRQEGPHDLLVAAALLVGALSIAGAIVLVVDIDSPFEGLIFVSREQM
jgi:hypothetical protein